MSKPQIDNAPGDGKVKVADRTERVVRWLDERDERIRLIGHDSHTEDDATELLALSDGEQPVVAWEHECKQCGNKLVSYMAKNEHCLCGNQLGHEKPKALTYKEADHE